MNNKKAYGFPVLELDDGLCRGLCFSEDGIFLGDWISSSIDFLRLDLAKHATGFDYCFVSEFAQLPPTLKTKIEEQKGRGK